MYYIRKLNLNLSLIFFLILGKRTTEIETSRDPKDGFGTEAEAGISRSAKSNNTYVQCFCFLNNRFKFPNDFMRFIYFFNTNI